MKLLPEELARQKIDKQLNNAGWDIVSRDEYPKNAGCYFQKQKPEIIGMAAQKTVGDFLRGELSIEEFHALYEVHPEINAFLQKIRNDGTYAEIVGRWIKGDVASSIENLLSTVLTVIIQIPHIGMLVK